MTLRELVHHVVRDRVQHSGRPLGELRGIGLQPFPQRSQRAVPPVPHGDHEVLADEHHDLAGAHHLARCRELLVLHVADRLEHGEERLPYRSTLGRWWASIASSTASGCRSKRSATPTNSWSVGSCRPRARRNHPSPPHPLHRVDWITALRECGRRPGRSRSSPPRNPAGERAGWLRSTRGRRRASRATFQEAADPSRPVTFQQIPCHRHPCLLAWVPSRRASRALASQSARPASAADEPVGTERSALFPGCGQGVRTRTHIDPAAPEGRRAGASTA